MATLPLKKPITVDGQTWTEIEFDPSLGALEDFQAALAAGADEIRAMIDLVAADGDVPREVARRIRSSDLQAIQAAMEAAGPLEASTPSSAETGAAGEASQPILHTS